MSNISYFKLQLVYDFLCESTSLKKQLLDELVIYATDSVRRMRRMRMLAQLCEYESQILKKIDDFHSLDPQDFDIGILKEELHNVCDRSS